MADPEDLVPSRKRLKDENGATMRMADDKEKEVEVRGNSLFLPRALATSDDR